MQIELHESQQARIFKSFDQPCFSLGRSVPKCSNASIWLMLEWTEILQWLHGCRELLFGFHKICWVIYKGKILPKLQDLPINHHTVKYHELTAGRYLVAGDCRNKPGTSKGTWALLRSMTGYWILGWFVHGIGLIWLSSWPSSHRHIKWSALSHIRLLHGEESLLKTRKYCQTVVKYHVVNT